MNEDWALRLEGLSKRFRLGGGRDTLWALRDVTFEVARGEVLGIVGRNGAGKTTLLRILSRITPPTAGRARVRGRVGSLLEVGTGFHRELTGRENVYLNGAILGMSKREIQRRFDEIVAFAEVDRFLDTPIKHYSSGMEVRLAFAVAAHLEPEILIVDEVLAVGDAAFQQKCLGKMEGIARGGRTALFVSHNMASIQALCGTAVALEQGKVFARGAVADVIRKYLEAVVEPQDTVIATRSDREGTGKLRFLEIVASTPASSIGPWQCGAPGHLTIRYRGRAPLRNVHVSLALRAPTGEGVLYLANDMTNASFQQVPAEGSFVCSFDQVSLLPGRYSVTMFCTVNGVVADWVKNAAHIEVASGDFYGTGKLPPAGYGFVVVPQSWQVIDNSERIERVTER